LYVIEAFVILDRTWSAIDVKPKFSADSDSNGNGIVPKIEQVSYADF